MRRTLTRAAGIAVVLILLFGFNVGYNNLLQYWQDIVIQCGIAVIMAVSLNIVNGYTGQFSIGHAGFMAVGAYAGGALSYLIWKPAQEAIKKAHPGWGSDQVLAAFAASHWWLLPAAMLLGGIAAALFGWMVGVPSLRLRGDYLAIVTLGFGEIIRVLLENANRISERAEFLGGSVGFFGIPRLSNFVIVYATAILVIVLARNLKFSLHGLAYQAVREDEIAANSMGVNTTSVKVTAFALAAFFAGVGGALFAHAYLFVPKTFGFILSMNYVVMIVLGGTGSITGATLAAIVLTLIPELLKIFKDRIPGFKDEYRLVLYALLLILMMILRPQGVFGRSELSLAWLRRRLGRGRPAGAAVPAAASAAPAAVPGPNGDAGEILRATDVRKVFGGLTAVDDLNLGLKCHELVGLIGPNGAGKTTVFNLLTGVYEPTSGTIHFKGALQAGERRYPPGVRLAWLALDTALSALGGWIVGTIITSTIKANVTWVAVLAAVGLALATARGRRRARPGAPPYQFAANGIARTFQNIRLFPELTVLENVMIGSYLRRRTGLWDALFRTGRMIREDAEVEARARALLRAFELDQYADEPANSLPYGAQRRLEIARALATGPSLLLLDEPAAGMNPQEKVELRQWIQQIRKEFGLTILLIEHDMNVVMGICERIYVLDYGEIIAHGTPEEIRRDPKVVAAYLGEEGGAVLTVENIDVYYGAIHALKGVSLTVGQGETVTMIGANGAGKSTTIRAISGLVRPRAGRITFEGEEITRVPPHRLVERGICQAPEGRRVFANLSVLENLQLGGYTHRRNPAQLREDMDRAFVLFPRLKERIHQSAGTLSGGEQQMLAIGRALMARPRLLMLDEPSLGLAPFLVQQIFHIIQEINQQGTTILLVEQNAFQALRLATRGYVLETGRVVLEDASANLLQNEDIKTAYLGT